MKLGFIILAHNQPDAVRRLVDILAGAGHTVVIHFDKNAPAAQLDVVHALEQTYSGHVRVVSQVHCVWGEWSLVEAVLVALHEFERMPEKPDYIHLMSGADFPIRPIADLEEFLRRNPDKDFIECCDVSQRRWVKGGLSLERFRFYFPVNFRTSRKTFDRLVRWHRKLKIRRKIPLAMTPHMGSQWWTLRWSTCKKILDFLAKNPRVIRYFRSTWIPDEAFFQTVLAHLIPLREIADLQLILHHLTATGRPYVVYPDHLARVRKLPHFFVRKVSPAALDGIESLARTRRSPIPRPAHLARIRDRVRGAIDLSYEQSAMVPGHPHGPPAAHKPKPVVVFLTENQAETELVRAHASTHPAAAWCGRPLAHGSIDLTEEILAAAGFNRGMLMVRSSFPEQFADTLATALPDDQVAVFVLQAGDTAATAAVLSRIPGIRFVSLYPHRILPDVSQDFIPYLPAGRIGRLLGELAPPFHLIQQGGPPRVKTHAFGRMGNYFHLDLTLSGDACITHPVLLFPEIAKPVHPEAVFTRADPSGGTRVLLLFWANDGAFFVVSKPQPAHLLMDLSLQVTPYPLYEVRESSVADFIGTLESFGDSTPWAHRLALESVAHSSITERYDFLLHAIPHWPPDSEDLQAALLLPEETTSIVDLAANSALAEFYFTAAVRIRYSNPTKQTNQVLGDANKVAVFFLTDNQAETELIRAHASNHPATVWCGRPLAHGCIKLTEEILAAAGLTCGMTMERSSFPLQIAQTLAAALPEDKAAVFAVQSGDSTTLPARLASIPGVRLISLHPRSPFPSFSSEAIRCVPDRRIKRFLNEFSPLGVADSVVKPSLELQTFGRIGNYFHVYAILHGAEERIVTLSFLLPGVSDPVYPEAIFTDHNLSGATRLLLFFWVDDGTYLDIRKQHPAYVLLDSGETSVAPPLSLLVVSESTVSEILGLVESFGDPALWSERLVLETVACAPIADRFVFLLRAKPHWPHESVEENISKLIPEENYPLSLDDLQHLESTQDPSPADAEWKLTLENIQQTSAQDASAACALAQAAIHSRELSRKEILRTIHPCLPRDSKWWLLALGANPDLGKEQLADALNSTATSTLQQGGSQLAELCLHAARIIDTTAQSPAWNLGLLLASQGLIEEAEKHFHGIRRHYANESISTCWPTLKNTAWPAQPWPTDGYTLPAGRTSWPRISIVTPSYNQGRFIEEAVLSVLNQDYPNLQYIVADGNSTDETNDILEKYRDRIDHLIIEPDDGQTQAINKGFRLADGEIIAWLNSDDMYAPGTLHQVALHWLASRVDVLAGICAEHRDHTFAVINKPASTNRDFNTAQLARIFPHWFSGMYFFQPEVFFTKEILEKVGLLDESLHYAMDYDLWMRFAKADARLEVIDWPFAFFRLHDAQKTTQSIACIAEQSAVRNRHHKIELREERKHQIERQITAFQTKNSPAIAFLGPHFESVLTEASSLTPSAVRFLFPASADDSVLTEVDAAIILIGSQRLEIPLIEQIRTTHPDLLLIGWFLDHDRDPHANFEAAGLVDIIAPTHSQTGDYLRNDSALMAPAVERKTLDKIAAIVAQDLIDSK